MSSEFEEMLEQRWSRPHLTEVDRPDDVLGREALNDAYAAFDSRLAADHEVDDENVVGISFRDDFLDLVP